MIEGLKLLIQLADLLRTFPLTPFSNKDGKKIKKYISKFSVKVLSFRCVYYKWPICVTA
jgi:hypothetical protein